MGFTKGKQKYWKVGDFTTTKNSYFYSYTHEEILINGYTLELYFLDNL